MVKLFTFPGDLAARQPGFCALHEGLGGILFLKAEVTQLIFGDLNTPPDLLVRIFRFGRDSPHIAQTGFPLYPYSTNWLNIAEIEISIVGHQLLDPILPEIVLLCSEMAALKYLRNQQRATID